MAAPFHNSTMAAGLKPFLRESVNAVRGPDSALGGASEDQTAKVGNAIFTALITTRKSRLAAVLLGNEAATAKAGRGSGPNGSRLGNVAHHCAEVISA